jgi:4-aminobutyrate aminotransferase-like enzyme
LRLLPPLTVRDDELVEAVGLIRRALQEAAG